ncbi:MAG TPA: VOC family protein [Gemmatimonadales bacterium]|nr:VOC family protein [Gemmatimonadales bacterium]
MAATTQLEGKSIAPGLTVNDLARSIRFYEGLGFEIEERWEGDGVVRGVMLKAGQVNLGLSQDDWKKGRDRSKGVGFRLWIRTSQDLDGVATRARSAGIVLDTEPHDTEWGSRIFETTDPDGFKLTISSER